jgi:trypsin
MHTRASAILWAPMLLVAALTAPAAGQATIEGPGKRIVGGEPTDISQHLWQVALQLEIGGETYLCGGSIVADRWVLTAAHCFTPGPAPARVRAKANATKYLEQGTWLDIEKVVVHEGYNPSTHEHDLALIRLRTRPEGKVIALATSKLVIPVGQPLEVTGWGAPCDGCAAERRLLKAEVPYVENATCNIQAAYDGAIRAGMMCAGYQDGKIDACQGDSGGPLVWRTRDGPVLVGVVSWGEGCALKLKYGVYTRVTSYADWVEKVVAGRN